MGLVKTISGLLVARLARQSPRSPAINSPQPQNVAKQGPYRMLAETMSAQESLRAAAIEALLPEMIEVSDNVRIMKEEVSVGLFKEALRGHVVAGPQAQDLQAILDNPRKKRKVLTHISMLDARWLAKQISFLTDRSFRVPTLAEWEQARDQLLGKNWNHLEVEGGWNLYLLSEGGPPSSLHLIFHRLRKTAIRLAKDI